MAARILVGSCSWTDPTLISCGRFYPPGVTERRGAPALLRRAVRHRRGGLDVLRAAVGSQQRALGGAHPGALRLQRQGVRPAHAPPRRGGAPPGLAAQRAARGGARQAQRLREGPAGEVLDDVWELHREALGPLAAAGKLGRRPVPVPALVRALPREPRVPARLPERLPGWPLAVEFRGGGWLDDDAADDTLRLLEEAGLAYVGVDEPQGFPNSTPPLTAVTAPLAIVRLHGRNAGTWESRTGAASDRFKYLYSDDELEEWVPRVRELAAQTQAVHVLFNNNYEDWGMQNARRMAHLLGVETLPPQTQLEIS